MMAGQPTAQAAPSDESTASATMLSSRPPPINIGDALTATPPSSSASQPRLSDTSDSAAAGPGGSQSSQSTSSAGEEASKTNLIINYVPSTMTQDSLRAMFEVHGPLKSCKLMIDRGTGKSLGYGFVDFVSEEDAASAIAALNGTRVDTKTLKVSIARPSSASITNANLYVKNLPPHYQEVELEQLFATEGEIISVRVLRDAGGSPKGVGFVRFDQHAQAQRAIEKLNNATPAGGVIPLVVKFADNARSRANSNANMSMAAMMTAMGPQLGTFMGYGSPPQSPPLRPYTGETKVPPSAVTPQGFCLFVYNLPATVTEDHLREMCRPYAQITAANIIRRRDTNASKGYGFVTVTSIAEATSVIDALNGSTCGDRVLQVSFKTERRPRAGSQGSLPPAPYMAMSQPTSPYAMAAAPPGHFAPSSPPAHYAPQSMPPMSPMSPQVSSYGMTHGHFTPPQANMMQQMQPQMQHYNMVYDAGLPPMTYTHGGSPPDRLPLGGFYAPMMTQSPGNQL
eukprot:TRINITY_DN7438_c0_g1_i1.p1 TRINITY_DN7438_c0_g1~~TRINITY_DN7438_c0_g1_i1.p1  ORF type:complete len:511 (+),score=125.10 TRINITY_DN7438_c0_g1_i1:490-2022(+)